MRKEHLFTVARFVSVLDCVLLGSYAVVGFFLTNLEFAWRLILFALSTYTAVGFSRGKRGARWLLGGFASTAILGAILQIAVLFNYPYAETGQYVAPVLALIVYSATLAGIATNRMPRTETGSLKYAASLMVVGLLVTGAPSFASDARLSADRTTINFGKILRATALQGTFRITNRSQATLPLTAKPACGCTVLRAPELVKSGETVDLPFYVHTFGDRPGQEEKSILLTWKDGKETGGIELLIQYQVIEGFLTYQSDRDLSRQRPNGTMIWSWSVDDPPTITSLAPDPLLAFTLEKLDTRRGIMFRLLAQPYKPLNGHGGETAYAKLVSQSGGVIEIPFHIDNDFTSDPEAELER